MVYSHEVQQMCVVKKGANHPCAPIPEEGKWVRATQITDISGLRTESSKKLWWKHWVAQV